MEILQQIFELCVIPLLGILTTYLVKLIRKKNKELDEKVSKEVSRKYIDMLADTITDCVVSTNQTYVDALKEANAFDKEAQKKAFELTYNNHNNVAETFSPTIDVIDQQVIGHIIDNQLFNPDSKFGKYNLLIKYFNHHTDITIEDIVPLERLMENDNNMENYFLLPMIIFVIEHYMKHIMTINDKTDLR